MRICADEECYRMVVVKRVVFQKPIISNIFNKIEYSKLSHMLSFDLKLDVNFIDSHKTDHSIAT